MLTNYENKGGLQRAKDEVERHLKVAVCDMSNIDLAKIIVQCAESIVAAIEGEKVD